MYQEIARNKRNSFFFMAGFIAIFALIGGIVGYAYQSWAISTWIIAGILIYVVIQYYASSRLAVMLTGAKPIEKYDNPELFRIVENLCLTTGLPMPKIYIINDASPNAFAAGRDPEHAILGVTTGILTMLDKAEMEGVIAHELGHIKNYDVRFKTIVFAMVAAIALLVDVAIRMVATGGRNDSNAGPFVLIALAVILIISPIAHLMQSAVGREREYLADVTSAEITRNPASLANALVKIGGYKGAGLQKGVSSTAHLFFNDPHSTKKSNKFMNWFNNLGATHPPIEDRVERLRELF